jgi:phage/plasmid-like protein (TIGR03299 family)
MVLTTIEDKIEAALKEQNSDEQPPTPANTRRGSIKVADVAPPVDPYTLKSFTLRDVPWGKLGAQLPAGEAVTALDASRLGGLDFNVELVEAGFRSPDHDGKLAKAKKSTWLTVPGRKAIIREDTGQFFSYVSGTYKPIQYSEAFAFMDEVSPEYVAAGTLGGGKQGFIVVKVPNHAKVNLEVKGVADPLSMYVVLRTSHDLTRALEVSVLNLRDKCMNALTLSSFNRNAPQRWSVRHVGNDPIGKLDEARRTLSRAEAYAKEFERIALELADIDLAIDEAQDVLKQLLPDRPKREDQVNAIVHAWQHSPTNGFTNNGWGLTNAVSEYFEWGRSEGTRTAASRFTGGLTGATHRYTNRTAQLLLRRR